MDAWAYAVVDNFWRCRKIHYKQQGGGKPETWGHLFDEKAGFRAGNRDSGTGNRERGTGTRPGIGNRDSGGDGTAKMAGQPEGLERNSPGQRPGLWGGNAPLFPPFSPERARRPEAPVAPFQGFQREQKRAANPYRQRLPWALPRAVTSQPFRLNGQTGHARGRYDCVSSAARKSGRNPAYTPAARLSFHRRDRPPRRVNSDRGEAGIASARQGVGTIGIAPRESPEILLTSSISDRNVLSCAASDERWPQAGRIGGFRGCPAAQAD